MNSSKITRKFERLLFNGIPEHPEHNWERNEYSNVSIRLTGKPRALSSNSKISKETKIWGYFEFDHENETETIIAGDTTQSATNVGNEI